MGYKRMTAYNYHRRAYVPGTAPRIDDPATCSLVTRLVNRLAAIEDYVEANGIDISEEVKDERQ